MKAARIKIGVAAIVFVGVAAFVLVSRGLTSHQCIDAPNPTTCETGEIEKLLAEHDVDEALATLEFYTSNSLVLSAQCHHLIHDVGREAYLEFSSGRQPTPSALWESCNYGFFHGFMQAMYTDTGDIKYVREFCVNPGERERIRIPRAECYHGLGHGFMDGLGDASWNDVPSLVRESLAFCKTIAQEHDDYQQCSAGVFHALRSEYFPPTERFKVDLSNPLKYCNEGTGDADKQECYAYMGQTLASIPPKSLGSSLELGMRYVPKAYMNSFVGGLAIMFASKRVDVDALRVCSELKNGLSEVCSSNYALGLLRRNPKGVGQEMALTFCEKLSVGSVSQSACFSRILRELSNLLSPEVAKNSCQRVGVVARGVCLSAGPTQ